MLSLALPSLCRDQIIKGFLFQDAVEGWKGNGKLHSVSITRHFPESSLNELR